MVNINPSADAQTEKNGSLVPVMDRRKVWFISLLFLILFTLIGTVFAFWQKPAQHPMRQPRFPSLRWFLQPIERYPELRLPAISSDLNAVYAVTGKDASHVWAVGSGGMIIHSADQGITWQSVAGPQAQQAAGLLPDNGPQSLARQGGADFLEFIGRAYAADATSKKALENKAKKASELPTQRPVPETSNQVPGPYKSESAGKDAVDERDLLDPKQAEEDATFDPRQQEEESLEGREQQEEPADPRQPVQEPVVFTNSPFSHERLFNWYDVQFVDENRGWVVGSGGAIATTKDGGQSWEIAESRLKATLYTVWIVSDAESGWAMGAGGTIFGYRGSSPFWERQIPRYQGDRNIYAIWLNASGSEGWAVGGNEVILRYDPKASWASLSRFRPISGETLRDLWIKADGSEGWAVGEAGRIWRYQNGGWDNRDTADIVSGADLYGVWFEEQGRRGWIVGDNGTILRTEDGGRNWNLILSGIRGRLTAVHFLEDGRHGWIVGDKGRILFSDDGGLQWIAQTRSYATAQPTDMASAQPAYSRYPAPWYYLFMLTILGQLVWSMGRQPRERREKDNGQEELAELKGDSRPPSAYDISIADEMVSDRPLGLNDPDPLDFKSIARGLSRFLRNKNTKPPLTIAVTGEWGSGKSSLMNMLREDLVHWGFRPIWFNAWHHQTEEHFLASLLESIRKQGVPRLLTLRGMRFRIRLLWYRSYWYWLAIVALASVTAFGIGYLKHDRTSRTHLLSYVWSIIAPQSDLAEDHEKESPVSVTSWMVSELKEKEVRPKVVETVAAQQHQTLQNAAKTQQPDAPPTKSKIFKNKWVLLEKVQQECPVQLTNRERQAILKVTDEEFVQRELRWDTLLATLLGGGGLGGFILLLLKGMTAFGAAPASLITRLSGRITVRRLRAAVGLRQRFAAEFGLVTKALRPHTLLLVIDDLDRCKPESVLNILETVNFLASSGTCYIVLGMDPAWVVSCVGERFKDVAAHILEQRKSEHDDAESFVGVAVPDEIQECITDGSDVQEDGTQRVTEFARRYLEKLVNVEVPVPVPESGQTRKLLTQRKQELIDRSSAALIQQWTQLAIRRFGVIFLVALMLIGGYLAGQTLGVDKTREIQTQQADKNIAKQTPVPSSASTNDKISASSEIKAEVVVDRGQFISSEVTGSSSAWRFRVLPLAAMVAFFIAVVIYGLFQLPPDPEVEDSEDFADALKIWHPWVIIKRQTPRSIKRYKNRVRYFAMRLRNDEEPQPMWKRLLKRRERSAFETKSEATPGADEAGLAEPLLVALGAIHHCNNRWIENDSLFKLIEDMKISELFDQSQNGDMRRPSGREIEGLEHAIKQHAASFPGLWPPQDDQRKKFIKLSKGIRTF